MYVRQLRGAGAGWKAGKQAERTPSIIIPLLPLMHASYFGLQLRKFFVLDFCRTENLFSSGPSLGLKCGGRRRSKYTWKNI